MTAKSSRLAPCEVSLSQRQRTADACSPFQFVLLRSLHHHGDLTATVWTARAKPYLFIVQSTHTPLTAHWKILSSHASVAMSTTRSTSVRISTCNDNYISPALSFQPSKTFTLKTAKIICAAYLLQPRTAHWVIALRKTRTDRSEISNEAVLVSVLRIW